MKSRYIYAFIAIVILIISCLFIDLNYSNLERLESFIVVIILPILIFCGFEKNIFSGRYSNRALSRWLFLLMIFIAGLLVVASVYYLLNLLGLNTDSRIIRSLNRIVGSAFIFFLVFKLLQLLYKRFQDFNQPGYYFFLGILPVFCWIVGVRIYKSGERVLGVLVFLNSIISILYVVFGIGNNYSNYFGINPELKDDFRKERHTILKNKFLSEEEKINLISALMQKYSEFELKELSEFRTLEIERRSKKEMLNFNFLSKDAILTQEMQREHQERIIDFHSKIVDKNIERYYRYAEFE